MPFFFDHYPYTNFHNINLDWVLEAVKAWGALVEENNIKFHNLEEAMTSFRTTLLSEWNTFHDVTQNEINQFEIWTQNYLQNLDVQEEINTKLDEMLSSGVLSPYFAPYIQTDVSEWLQNNITPTSPAIDASLTISGAGADAAVTGRKINGLKADLGDITGAKFTTVDIVAYPSFASSIMEDGYHNANGTWTSGDNYTSYVLNKGRSYEIAFGALASSSYYVQMCIFNGSVEQANFVSRFRSLNNNLPTIDNPMTITENQIVVIAVTDATLSATITTSWNQGVKLNSNTMEQIRTELNEKKLKLIYNNITSDYETERLYIYTPTINGYIRYNFAHYVNESRNSNCWIIHPLYAVTDNLIERYAVTTSGEFECALKIDGAPDFMGGSAHGSENYTSIHVLIDGTEITPSSIITLTDCDEIRVIECSNLYDPNDETTLVAVHGKEYVWTKDKLIINQSVIWKVAENLRTSYLAMFPIAKTAIDNLMPNDTFETIALPDDGYIRRTGIDSITAWSDTLGLVVTFSIPKWDITGTNLQNVGEFQVTDNNGGVYHKMYYECCTNGSVAINDVWKTTTEYTIQIGA